MKSSIPLKYVKNHLGNIVVVPDESFKLPPKPAIKIVAQKP